MFLLVGAVGCTTQTLNSPSAIQHTVFIIKENRTFDNYFAGFPGADSAVKGMTSTGKVVNLSHMADSSPINLCNNWDCAWKAYDEGRMDKFDLLTGNLDAYTRMMPPDLPNYWAYAQRYVLADRYFTSVQGPSLPNHLFTVAATAGGVIENVDNSTSGKNCDGTPSGTAPGVKRRPRRCGLVDRADRYCTANTGAGPALLRPYPST